MTTEKELRDMRRKLDDQYKKDRETLDRMLDFIVRANGSSEIKPAEDSKSTLSINERIANYVLQIEGNFTMQDAWSFIKQKDPEFGAALTRMSMSTGIWKMHKAGKIKIIIPKKGRSAAIYSKK
ncbi:MAG: hypothetical protein HY300_11745 [Verrucomicrobia bacterium]|nr:hypothetical protein [Verrucomicrobiota bacterium]